MREILGPSFYGAAAAAFVVGAIGGGFLGGFIAALAFCLWWWAKRSVDLDAAAPPYVDLNPIHPGAHDPLPRDKK
jgi:hypothetical protein